MTPGDADYQRDLSLVSPILLDRTHKQPKVDKMLAVLGAAGVIKVNGEVPVQEGHAIDVGCSRGFFVAGLAPYYKTAIGADIDRYALRLAESERSANNLLYIQGDSQSLPLARDSMDLVICNHVYEHVPSAETLMDEIFRILKPGGVCYFGAASRLIIMEPHYHLLFLSWLPKPLAHRYMRLFGRGDFYFEKLRTRRALARLTQKFNVEDYTLAVLLDPDRFKARDMIPTGSLIEYVPRWLWRVAYALLPTYILILRKP